MKKRYRDAKGRFCKKWQTPEHTINTPLAEKIKAYQLVE